MKVCAKCKQAKPVEDFTKAKRYTDGYASYCKACTKILINIWKLNNPIAVKRIRNKSRDVCIEKNKKRDKKYVDELVEHYVKNILIINGFSSETITSEIIEIKRLLLKTKREIKNNENKD